MVVIFGQLVVLILNKKMITSKMWCHCVFFVCLLNCFASAGVLREDDWFELDIVHYNDFHDRFEETSLQFPLCKTNGTECLGGFARLYHEIITLLKEKPDALLLNAGDVFQGTYWYTLLKWNVTQHFINMLPNDAHALGNHEFDDGVAGLAPYLAALNAPVVAANIDTSKEPALNGLYVPHIIVERKGRKIGIIGVTTPETNKSSNPGNVIFQDPIEIVRNQAQLLTDKGIDIIVVLSHCGLAVDEKMAKLVGENVDIIVGGHTHSLLWNGTSPSKEEVSGPYPVIVEAEGKPEHKVLVVTASAFSKYLGHITAFFDQNGELVSFDGNPVFLNRSIPEDPNIKILLEPYTKQLHSIVNEVIGFAESDLLARPCGSGECALGDLYADSLMDAAKKSKLSNLQHVAFLNRNNMRGSIPQGNITRGVVISMVPFTNKVVTLVVPGKVLFKMIEHCLTNAWTEDPFIGPWMPLVSGIEVTLNTTSKKVVSIFHRGEEITPIDPNKDYQLVTISFLVYGNSFPMIKKHARDIKPIGTDSNILEDYIRKVSTVSNHVDRRLIVVR